MIRYPVRHDAYDRCKPKRINADEKNMSEISDKDVEGERAITAEPLVKFVLDRNVAAIKPDWRTIRE